MRKKTYYRGRDEARSVADRWENAAIEVVDVSRKTLENSAASCAMISSMVISNTRV